MVYGTSFAYMQKYPLTTDTMKGQKQADYEMTLTTIAGRELAHSVGSLRYICEQLGEHYYQQIDGYFESYHKIRRELLRAGGAYSCVYPCAGCSPVVLTIVLKSLLPAPAPETDEAYSLRALPPLIPQSILDKSPLLPSVQKAIDTLNEQKRANATAPRLVVCVACEKSFTSPTGSLTQPLCPACTLPFPEPLSLPS
jgi:hypothetical protein